MFLLEGTINEKLGKVLLPILSPCGLFWDEDGVSVGDLPQCLKSGLPNWKYTLLSWSLGRIYFPKYFNLKEKLISFEKIIMEMNK